MLVVHYLFFLFGIDIVLFENKCFRYVFGGFVRNRCRFVRKCETVTDRYRPLQDRYRPLQTVTDRYRPLQPPKAVFFCFVFLFFFHF